MFTGIVTHRGRVARAEDGEAARTLTVVPTQPFAPLAAGDSVAVDGVCLTVASFEGEGFVFEAVPETLRRTTLGDLAAGDEVNLEAALRVGDALGGHIVQGHVDGTGTVVAVERGDGDVRMAFSLAADLHRGLLPKGSVTLDGVSLTVGEVWSERGEPRPHRFSVYLVPHTLAVTGFGRRAVGERVNVELDVIGRWIEHHLRH